MSKLRAYQICRGGSDWAGSKTFRPYADRAMKMPYYNVPAETLEDAASLVAWSEPAIAVAKSSATRKK